MELLTIQSVNGCVLTYSKSDLKNNQFIRGTLIDKHFFGNFAPQTILILQYSSEMVRHLITLIRDGTLQTHKIKSDACISTLYRRELSRMLDYISGENREIAELAKII